VIAVCRRDWVCVFVAGIVAAFTPWPARGSDSYVQPSSRAYTYGARAALYSSGAQFRPDASVRTARQSPESDYPYRFKFAYGRTFGTSTELDYVTVELSRRVSDYPAFVVRGTALGEFELAFLASHVCYKEGVIERVKRLDFRDGYEVGFIPKSRFTIPTGVAGLASYLESGAGIGYVSETYRNSGSRWNWSLLAGCGLEKSFRDQVVSLRMQWRHLSNGNMWGKGDELHNSNSGTDMIQGMAAFIHYF